jgi:hypothetical protein
MIQLLGDRFSSGASVRNEDGMLPLHLVLIACATPVAATVTSDIDTIDIVKAVLKLFPGAIGVADNEGNLPIHTAASVLRGPQGAREFSNSALCFQFFFSYSQSCLILDIMSVLLNEADKLASGPSCLRFRNKVSFHQLDDETFETSTAISQSDSSVMGNESTSCLLVRNDMGYSPLLISIYSHAGWEVIEALLANQVEPFPLDAGNNNALHLLVSEHYKDPAAALVVLHAIPVAAARRNDKGMLPIEVSWGSSRICSCNYRFSHMFAMRRLLVCKCYPVKSFLAW